MRQDSGELTQLLAAWGQGDSSALDRLVLIIEPELKRLARVYLSRERPDHTLEANALVNEAYLRLTGWQADQWQSRGHFFSAASKLMRHILVDHARRRARRPEGNALTISICEPVAFGSGPPGVDVLALDEALARLGRIDERKARHVELRFFGGLSEAETAQVMGMPLRTIQREWSLARAWLFRELAR